MITELRPGYQERCCQTTETRGGISCRENKTFCLRFHLFEYSVERSGEEGLFLTDTFICHIGTMDINLGVRA